MTATIIDISQARRDQPEHSATPEERLLWRAVVRVGSTFAAAREGDRVEWHLVGCDAPLGEGTHCNEGQHLVETIGQPDGHCVLNGRCGRCGDRVRTSHKKAA